MKRSKKKKNSSKRIHCAVVVNDLQIPYEDQKCKELLFMVLEHLGPDTEVVLNGDIIDGAEFSNFTHPLEMIPWHEESARLHEFLQKLSKYKVAYLLGNHEERIREASCKQDRAKGIKAVKEGKDVVIEALELKKYPNITSYPVGGVLKLGSLTITHGEGRPSGIAGNFARKYLANYNKSVMIGHSHRMAFTPITVGAPGDQTTIGAWENGCLCRTTAWYHGGSTSANWQQGFSVVYYEDGPDGYFHVVQIPIIRHRFIFDGKLFEA